ncbi:hypothetical protein BE15_45360 [Sorangium cellulosum]|uniref:Uncharacterized protein n=1 Tax=Sorangium cellulosum TaxID=56 RepID=A0A150Q9Y1_SORCE|nr:hypothetical protein BE15_45360 [Sorangium cellulosum]
MQQQRLELSLRLVALLRAKTRDQGRHAFHLPLGCLNRHLACDASEGGLICAQRMTMAESSEPKRAE